jgi:hypothetical protein
MLLWLERYMDEYGYVYNFRLSIFVDSVWNFEYFHFKVQHGGTACTCASNVPHDNHFSYDCWIHICLRSDFTFTYTPPYSSSQQYT